MTHQDAPPALEARTVTLGYGREPVIRDLSTAIPRGARTAIVGPNGSGKSTLLRGFARLLPVRDGSFHLDGQDITRLSPVQAARRIAVLPQGPTAPDGITVGDLVGRGRYPHQGWFRRWTPADDAAVEQALSATRTLELMARPVSELSGGQRQRVWIAMALAQQTDVLLLDEPTTFLDLSFQLEILDLLTELNRENDTTVVFVIHEINMAFRYADHLIAMRDGAIVASGAPQHIVDEALIERVFDVRGSVTSDPYTGAPMVIPASRAG